MSRLGLGLAKIKQGKLVEGRQDIEIAASLDPGNSLIRSYLGKAFFEEKNTKLALRQLGIAKELDSHDPTPWLYSAICKQSVSQPVDALQDLQKSIELNDNRAVYRSQFLLDEDLAVRNVSLADAYNDLGFQQLALVTGWNSLDHDPANSSAHRFLADSYSTLPRHGTARASELLQAQLLQPANVLPVHPQLAEYNSFVPYSMGPSEPGFNEYAALYNRDRLFFMANAMYGGNATIGDEIFLSGLNGRFSYSFGQYHYESDGFRENNAQKKDIFNLFSQLSLSPGTTLQMELKHTENEQGDLELRFDPNNFYPEKKYEEEVTSARIGLHHTFSPGSDLIGFANYWQSDSLLAYPEFLFDLRVNDNEDKRIQGELRYIKSFERNRITFGMGHADVSVDYIFSSYFPPPLQVADEFESKQTDAYLYTWLDYPDSVTWTLGASTSFYDSDDINGDQFNPKFGMTWKVFPKTTFRAAFFRTMQKMLFTGQTVEPTQVAGFNQFYDDGAAADSWRLGTGLDHQFSKTLFGGIEYSKRDTEVPFLAIDGTTGFSMAKTVDWKEETGRFYCYWTPFTFLSLSTGLYYDKLERGSEYSSTYFYTDLETITFPLELNYFHPAGISSRVKISHLSQQGNFIDVITEMPYGVGQEDDFWVVDASIRYQFPDRYGFLSLEAWNLFDSEFSFQDIDPARPDIHPERLVMLRFSIML